MLRYLHNLKAFLSGREVAKGDLLFEEIEKSKLVWLKYEQCFIKNSENYTKLKSALNLFIDSENVIRCRSRIAEANQLTFNEKYPILLKNDSKFNSLVSGFKMPSWRLSSWRLSLWSTGNLINLRKNYWIVRGLQKVKLILRNCVVCKIIQGKTLAPPETLTLLSYRLNCNHAFESTGLDFAGHLYYKGDYSSSGAVYKCCFTLYMLRHTSCSFRVNHRCWYVDSFYVEGYHICL